MGYCLELPCLEAILTHYAPEVVLTSPVAAKLPAQFTEKMRYAATSRRALSSFPTSNSLSST